MSPRGPFHIGALEGIARRLSWKVKLPSPDHRLEFKLLPGIQEVPNESHLEAILGHYRQWNELERGAKEIEKTAASNLEGVIHQAFHEMVERHKEQQREGSGEPYSVHPMHLAFWAAQSGMSWRAIVAALLHDVVEDTGVSLNYIKQTYGQDVAYLVYKL
ncbi:MAG TPA: HD domain-containing protein, partial [Candidatus Norongarragalinales archaeon]|nr:HD domain-containing protein [Candidatus Norongarragalinales archaeon]